MNKAKIEVGISFGIMSPKISKQLRSQGLKFKTNEMKDFEQMRDSINGLYFDDILSEKEKDKLIKKLFTKIKAHLAKNN